MSWAETAKDLFRRAGLDYPDEKVAASKPCFRVVPLAGESLSAAIHSTIAHVTTRNVVGVVKGSTNPNDVVLFTAHWDHLGAEPDTEGSDKTYSGAIDNGTGVSAILELAEAFAAAKSPPGRTITFIAWTLEEQGLLGSHYFTDQPLWPLNHIVGGVNFDCLLPLGRAHDMVINGSGR